MFLYKILTQILTKANLNVGFPRLVGVCGRAGVVEGELTPLASMLDESFNVRASLAAQILTMVDDFMVSYMTGLSDAVTPLQYESLCLFRSYPT